MSTNSAVICTRPTTSSLLFPLTTSRKDEKVWNHAGWKPLFYALGFTCIMFLIRSVFRTVELSEG